MVSFQKVKLKKTIIGLLAAMCVVTFVWNIPYFYWHFWIKWKLTDSKPLNFIPHKVFLDPVEALGDDLCSVDFLVAIVTVPRNVVEIKKQSEAGILLRYKEFLIGINDFAEAEKDQAWITDIKKESAMKKIPNFVPDTYFEMLVEQLRLTPDEIKYLEGYRETQRKITMLRAKYFRYLTLSDAFFFESPYAKGILGKTSDGSAFVSIFSSDEKRGFTIHILKGTEKLPINKAEELARYLAANIHFGDVLPDREKLKVRIDTVVRSGTLPCMQSY
jgi:hypothetical protein